MSEDDVKLQEALKIKEEGNQHYRQGETEEALRLYNEAAKVCPATKASDLAVVHQNRAASLEKLGRIDEAIEACSTSISFNNKYAKAIERRAKLYRETGAKMENLSERIQRLGLALEDVSVVALMQGQTQTHLPVIEELLKQLGSAEAVLAAENREPSLPSKYMVVQYFSSFCNDPVYNDTLSAHDSDYGRALECLRSQNYEEIIAHCDKEIASAGENASKAKLLRATFFVLCKQPKRGMDDLTDIIEGANDDEQKDLLVNALVKRASLYISRCSDPVADTELAYADFSRAEKVDPGNPDVYHQRGQMSLITDNTSRSVEDLKKAEELKPEFGLPRVQRLYTEFLQAKLVASHDLATRRVEELKETIEKFPDCVDSYAICAKVLAFDGKYDEAMQMYDRGLKAEPDNANLVVHKALLNLEQTKNYEDTIVELNKAIKMDDKCEFAFESLANIEVQRDNLERAIQLYDSVIPLVNTELEMGHLFGLRHSAAAKLKAKNRLAQLPSGMSDVGLD